MITYNYIFTFGKYKNISIKTVLDTDPKYVNWAIEKVFKNKEIHKDLYIDVKQRCFNPVGGAFNYPWCATFDRDETLDMMHNH